MSPAFFFIYTLVICRIEKKEHFLLLNGRMEGILILFKTFLQICEMMSKLIPTS